MNTYKRLLSEKRGHDKSITITITKFLLDTTVPLNIPSPFLQRKAGWAANSSSVYKRIDIPEKISDSMESGIALATAHYTDNNFAVSDPPIMAHEIGHLLLRGSNDHYQSDGSEWPVDNLMREGATDIKLEPIQWIHALGINGSASYFVLEK